MSRKHARMRAVPRCPECGGKLRIELRTVCLACRWTEVGTNEGWVPARTYLRVDGKMGMPDNPLMAVLWRDALLWTAGQPEAVAEFEKATGMSYSPPKSWLEAEIDRASGADDALCRAFIDWFNTNVWGPDA